MKMTRRNDVLDHRTRWKSDSSKTLNIQENFTLETFKTASPYLPVCLELIGTKGSYHLSSGWKLAGNRKDPIVKPRKVILPKENDGRTLTKSSPLPPIHSPRISTISISSSKTCVSSWGVGCQEKKANILSTSVRMDKALFSRQRQGCQLICNGLAVFNDSLQVQNQDLRQDTIPRVSAGLPQDEHLDVEPSNFSAKDREVITERMKNSASISKNRLLQPFSDSATEMENENEIHDSQEDEYYTNQRITAWIVKVNASLFSSSKDEIIDQMLEEQDVDTIKIIYD